jgi:hypothetical protein
MIILLDQIVLSDIHSLYNLVLTIDHLNDNNELFLLERKEEFYQSLID